MGKLFVLLLAVWLMWPGITAQAAAAEENTPLDWEISVKPKPSSAELERERWAYVLENSIGVYWFDRASLQVDTEDRNIRRVLVKAVFTNPEIVESLNKKHQEQLQNGDKTAYSELQMLFRIPEKEYAVTGTKIFSEQGVLLADSSKEAVFSPVPPQSFAEAMFDIAAAFYVKK